MVIRAARDPKSKEVIIHRQQEVESVRDTITRIQQMADPISFLTAVQNGAMIEVIALRRNDDGQMVQVIHYEQATIKQRIETARYLAGKILPTMSVQKVVVEDNRPQDEENTQYKHGEDGQPTFAQLVHAAASKASQIVQKVTIVDPPPVNRGAHIGSAGEEPELMEAEDDDPDSGEH